MEFTNDFRSIIDLLRDFLRQSDLEGIDEALSLANDNINKLQNILLNQTLSKAEKSKYQTLLIKFLSIKVN